MTVGIDVEGTERLNNVLDLAERFFSRNEVAALRSLPEGPQRTLEFIELWTLKEAFLKATGLGLSQPLNTIAFDLSMSGSIAFTLPIDSCRPDVWHFALFKPTPQTRLAVAANYVERPVVTAHVINKTSVRRLDPLRRTM